MGVSVDGCAEKAVLSSARDAQCPGEEVRPLLGHMSEDTEQPAKPMLSDLVRQLPVIDLKEKRCTEDFSHCM